MIDGKKRRLRGSPKVVTRNHQTRPLRVVPAFTICSLQKGVVVGKPSRLELYKAQPKVPSLFKQYYDRGNLPVKIQYNAAQPRLTWTANQYSVSSIPSDYQRYLPLFFDGLRETRFPYSFVVGHGIQDLLKIQNMLVEEIIPQLILPMKRALYTRDSQVICSTLRAFRLLFDYGEGSANALLPYLHQLLPPLKIYVDQNGEENSENKRQLYAEVRETLEHLEDSGGVRAVYLLQRIMPTHQTKHNLSDYKFNPIQRVTYKGLRMGRPIIPILHYR